MKGGVTLCALCLLIGVVVLVPTPVDGVGWISGADAYVAPWVKEIDPKLLKSEYLSVFAGDPRTPQVVGLRKLNQAAKAQEAREIQLVQQLVRDALAVFEEGVRRHYYSESEVEPITSLIRQHVPNDTN